MSPSLGSLQRPEPCILTVVAFDLVRSRLRVNTDIISLLLVSPRNGLLPFIHPLTSLVQVSECTPVDTQLAGTQQLSHSPITPVALVYPALDASFHFHFHLALQSALQSFDSFPPPTCSKQRFQSSATDKLTVVHCTTVRTMAKDNGSLGSYRGDANSKRVSLSISSIQSIPRVRVQHKYLCKRIVPQVVTETGGWTLGSHAKQVSF